MSPYYAFNILKHNSLIICLFALFTISSKILFGHPNDVQVMNVYRLSHERYNVQNLASGQNNPYLVWNRDHTRILMFESFNSLPGFPKGREHVWATMEDAKGGYTDLADYQAKWKKVPGVFLAASSEGRNRTNPKWVYSKNKRRY